MKEFWLQTNNFDYTAIEKIKSLRTKKFVPNEKAWLVGSEHEKELKEYFKLPHFLISEQF